MTDEEKEQRIKEAAKKISEILRDYPEFMLAGDINGDPHLYGTTSKFRPITEYIER